MWYKIHIIRDDHGSVSSQVFEHKFYDVDDACSYWKDSLSTRPDLIDDSIRGILDSVGVYDRNKNLATRLDLNMIPKSYDDIVNTSVKPFYILAVANDDEETYLVSPIEWNNSHFLAHRFRTDREAEEYFIKHKDHINNIHIKGPYEFIVQQVSFYRQDPLVNTNVKTISRASRASDISLKYYIVGHFYLDSSNETKDYPILFMDRDENNNAFFTACRPKFSFDTIEKAEDVFYSNRNKIYHAACCMVGRDHPVDMKPITGIRKFSLSIGVTDSNTGVTNYAHVFDL